MSAAEFHIPLPPSEWCRIPPDGPRPYRITPELALMDGPVCIGTLAKCIGGKAPVTLAHQLAQNPMLLDVVRRFLKRDEFLINIDDSDPHLLTDARDVMRAAGEAGLE